MKTLEGKEIISAAIQTVTSIEADASSKLPDRIHLLRAGTFNTQKYGRIEITADDLREFAGNFKAGRGRPGPEGNKGGLPVNIGHNKGGVAAAWINDLEVEGNDLYGTKLDWTGAGKAEVESKNYKYISSEFTPRCMGGLWASAEDSTKRFRNVFTGAALTNIPMFNGNQGIMASDEVISEDGKETIYINATEEEQNMTLDGLRVKENKDLTADERKFVEAHATELSDVEKKKFNIEANAEEENKVPVSIEAAATSEGVVSVEASEVKKVLDENTELKKQVEAANTDKSELEKTVEAHAEQLKASRRKEIEASVDKHIARGAIVADQKDTWVEKIEADASMETLLEQVAGNKVVEADAMGKETGSGSVEATSELDKLATELSEKKGITYSQATVDVLASNVELANKVNAEREALQNVN